MGNDGFLTGLKLWLIFFLAFFLLQYPIELAILLGVTAGVAGSVIATALPIRSVPQRLLPPPKPEAGASRQKRFGLRERAKQWVWLPWFNQNKNRS